MTDTATHPTAAALPAGLKVLYVGVTLPDRGGRRSDTPAAGSKVPAPPPGTPGRSVLRAFCWVKIGDGLGLEFVVSQVRLMYGRDGYFINYPDEMREAPCPSCHGRNKPKARFCNWCGARVPEQPPEACRHHQLFNPSNAATADVMVRAVVDAYEAELGRDRAAAVAHAGRQCVTPTPAVSKI